MPRRPPTRSPTSSSLVETGCHSPSMLSESATEACWLVVPVPRFLGRCHAGERTNRNRRPDRVASSVTSGATGVGVVGAQPLGGAALPGDLAVQREADCVQHAGLAGSGGPGEQEETGLAELVEVDR